MGNFISLPLYTDSKGHFWLSVKTCSGWKSRCCSCSALHMGCSFLPVDPEKQLHWQNVQQDNLPGHQSERCGREYTDNRRNKAPTKPLLIKQEFIKLQARFRGFCKHIHPHHPIKSSQRHNCGKGGVLPWCRFHLTDSKLRVKELTEGKTPSPCLCGSELGSELLSPLTEAHLSPPQVPQTLENTF
jgi:hypothetical protein